MDPLLTVDTPSIYTGPWINWARGRVQGATLTLSTRDGAFLVAFLALFVRIAGNHLWNVICWIVFVSRATDQPRDGLHHQQQALLRSRLSDLSSISQFSFLATQWKSVLGTRLTIRRSLGLICLSVIHSGLLLAAGIFSSSVAGTVSDALLNNVSCGQFPIPLIGQVPKTLEDIYTFAAITARVQRNLGLSAAYAESCYRSSIVNASWSDCLPLGRSRIEWNKTIVPCPFAEEMCTTSAVRFDTGLIDSDLQLGINAPQKDRVGYRRAMVCSPIKTDGYRTDNIDRASTGLPDMALQGYDSDETFSGFFYGANEVYNSSGTYYIPTRNYPKNNLNIGKALIPYELGVETNAHGYGNSFDAIPELQVPNVFTSLLFLSNRAAYFQSIDDPWFHATEPISEPLLFPDGTVTFNITMYENPEVVSVVGCTEEWQWCNQNTGSCTPWMGLNPFDGVEELQLNTRQNSTLNRIFLASGPSFLVPTITFLGASSLLADKSAGLNSLPLPSDQWIQEFDHWFATGMATLQLDLLQYVMGDGDNSGHLYQLYPSAEEEWMCTSQITKRTDFTSFSILSLILIVVAGVCCMLLSIYLYEILPFSQRFRQNPKGSAWIFHGLLQLQSRVFESKGLGGGRWQRSGRVLPTTKSDVQFQLPTITEHMASDEESTHSSNTSMLFHTSSGLSDHVTIQSPYDFKLKSKFRKGVRTNSDISEADTLLIQNGYRMS